MQFNLLLVGAKCTWCGECADNCTSGALSMVNSLLSWDNNYCSHCGACMENCTENAIRVVKAK